MDIYQLSKFTKNKKRGVPPENLPKVLEAAAKQREKYRKERGITDEEHEYNKRQWEKHKDRPGVQESNQRAKILRDHGFQKVKREPPKGMKKNLRVWTHDEGKTFYTKDEAWRIIAGDNNLLFKEMKGEASPKNKDEDIKNYPFERDESVYIFHQPTQNKDPLGKMIPEKIVVSRSIAEIVPEDQLGVFIDIVRRIYTGNNDIAKSPEEVLNEGIDIYMVSLLAFYQISIADDIHNKRTGDEQRKLGNILDLSKNLRIQRDGRLAKQREITTTGKFLHAVVNGQLQSGQILGPDRLLEQCKNVSEL